MTQGGARVRVHGTMHGASGYWHGSYAGVMAVRHAAVGWVMYKGSMILGELPVRGLAE